MNNKILLSLINIKQVFYLSWKKTEEENALETDVVD
jgi:hypothetical protein